MRQPEMILLDTNVWVDSYLGERPFHKNALSLMSNALDGGITLLYAVTSVKDVYYQVAMAVKQEARRENQGSLSQADAMAANAAASACVETMMDVATAVGLDASDVWLARKLQANHPDFEDNFVIAAVMRSSADFLVTNDQKLLLHSPVPTLNTADMAQHLRSCMESQQAIEAQATPCMQEG